MNVLALTAAYLRHRPLNTCLNLSLLILGVGTLTAFLLFSLQIERRLDRNTHSIDLVIGARGSALQLVLAGVHHVDDPAEYLPPETWPRLRDRSGIGKVVPVYAVGRYAEWRVVATSRAFADFYGTSLLRGRFWQGRGEVVVGSDVAKQAQLSEGDQVVVAGKVMDVVGIYAPSGSVIDYLVLTSLDNFTEPTILAANSSTVVDSDTLNPEKDSAGDMTSDTEQPAASFITPPVHFVLVSDAPDEVIQAPGLVLDNDPRLLAASPRDEIKHVERVFGVGILAFRWLGAVLFVLAGLGIFIALYHSMNARRGDLAVMRSLGASRAFLVRQVFTEGLAIASVGSLIGVFSGHFIVVVVIEMSQQVHDLGLTGFTWYREESWLLIISLLAGLAASALPAIQAYRTDIAGTLAEL